SGRRDEIVQTHLSEAASTGVDDCPFGACGGYEGQRFAQSHRRLNVRPARALGICPYAVGGDDLTDGRQSQAFEAALCAEELGDEVIGRVRQHLFGSVELSELAAGFEDR